MIKIYAVIDTNVLVSALLSRFKNTSTVQLLQLLILGDITPIYNDEILNEYQDVLTRPKFGFPNTIIDETLEVIKRYGINSSRKDPTNSCQILKTSCSTRWHYQLMTHTS
jgi:putative PIN family toxin of toxin-antitoxin system